MNANLQVAKLAYGDHTVLSHVDLNITTGERVVLLGASGAGKTTLTAALYAQLIAKGRRVALAPQDAGLVPQLSVGKNVLMGRLDDHSALYNLTNLVRIRRADQADIHAILGDLGLQDYWSRPVESLSGGQKQRVSLARALYRGGDILIADEPVSAVDESQSRRILHRIFSQFSTVVMALHDVGLAREFGTRLIGLKDGHIQFDATPKSVNQAMIAALYG